jgi:hypothetical protein
MKLIRLVFFSVLSLFAIASFIGILLPANVLVSRAVDVMAPGDSVRPHLVDIHQWKSWMDGMQQASVTIESPLKADLAGTKVALTNITDSSVVSTWLSPKRSLQTSTIRIIKTQSDKQVIVQWQFEQKLSWYPWERFGSMMNDKILGTMMEKNLQNLKTLSEQ